MRTVARVCLIALLTTTALQPLFPAPARQAETKVLLVAWSPANLPNRTEAALDRIDGVRASTVVFGLGWLTKTLDRERRVVERAPSGYAWPIEIAFIEPGEYARFVPSEHRDLIRSLDGNEAVAAQMETKLRRGATRWRFGSRRVRVAETIGNKATQGFEALMSKPVPAFVQQTLRFVLIEKDPDVSKERIRRAIKRVVGEDHPLRIKSNEQTRFLRYGDVVQPQLLIKKHFGEFAAQARRQSPRPQSRLDGKPHPQRLRADPGHRDVPPEALPSVQRSSRRATRQGSVPPSARLRGLLQRSLCVDRAGSAHLQAYLGHRCGHQPVGQLLRLRPEPGRTPREDLRETRFHLGRPLGDPRRHALRVVPLAALDQGTM